MKKVKTLNTNTLKDFMKKGGCGECQTSRQSVCKTSCTVGNQTCENSNRQSVPKDCEAGSKYPYGPLGCRGTYIVCLMCVKR